MKTQNKTTLWILAIMFGIFCLYQFARMIAPGSYPFAEVYTIDAPEEKVLNAIKEFKTTHPEFIVPNVTINKGGSFNLSESEGRKENSFWNFNYFYYKKDNQIVFTWTRRSLENNKTEFAFVGLNDGLDLGNWQNVNDDFGYLENRNVKAKFERLILVPVSQLSK